MGSLEKNLTLSYLEFGYTYLVRNKYLNNISGVPRGLGVQTPPASEIPKAL